MTNRSFGGSLAWGWSQLVFTALAWGLNWPVLKLAVAEFDPFGFRAITGVGGVALLLVIALVRGDRLRVPRGQFDHPFGEPRRAPATFDNFEHAVTAGDDGRPDLIRPHIHSQTQLA